MLTGDQLPSNPAPAIQNSRPDAQQQSS